MSSAADSVAFSSSLYGGGALSAFRWDMNAAHPKKNTTRWTERPLGRTIDNWTLSKKEQLSAPSIFKNQTKFRHQLGMSPFLTNALRLIQPISDCNRNLKTVHFSKVRNSAQIRAWTKTKSRQNTRVLAQQKTPQQTFFKRTRQCAILILNHLAMSDVLEMPWQSYYRLARNKPWFMFSLTHASFWVSSVRVFISVDFSVQLGNMHFCK